MRGLVLVAHPDDETLFAGAAMLARPDVEWEVLCLTYTDFHERGQELAEALQALRHLKVDVRGGCLGMADDGWPPTPRWYSVALSVVHTATAGQIWDVVLTHSAKGEYGHPHHIAVNSIARHLWTRDRIWEFRYPGLTGIGPQRVWRDVHSISVSSLKAAVFEAAYGHRLGSLRQHMPDLIAYELDHGPELYTGEGEWPL